MINRRGFTLVELLVVIAIIGILATLSTVSLNVARVKSRDARRLSDVSQLQLALYLYFDDHNEFPIADMDTQHAVANWPIVNDGLNGTSGGRVYMRSVPKDPSNKDPYVYGYNSNGSEFLITFNLEEGGAREVLGF
ncbi:MAG: prepilin-type N-terminal cleavage/methylation domain-containing protein [Candidatus Buchananbacteria bacterium]